MSGPLRTDPDRALVLRCQAEPDVGFQGAFREIYDLYKDRVYNTCFRITGNASDALDASQETFGILHRKISGFRFESKFSSWVYRISINASIDIKRRHAARFVASLDVMQEREFVSGKAAPFQLEDEGTEQPTAAASRHELEDDIQCAIDRLSPKMRSIIVLRYLESQSYEEIAETLEISLGTVKSRLSRAHDALDRELTPLVDRHFIHGSLPG